MVCYFIVPTAETPPPAYSPTIDSRVSSPPDGAVIEAMKQPQAMTPTGG